MKHRFLTYSFFLLPLYSIAGFNKPISREDYIAMHKGDALNDMKKTGVPASVTLAQALLESDDGNSTLATEANNHFGIKCADWVGPTYTKDDDQRDECFRKYKSVLESYDDHSNFLKTRDRYAFLFNLDITDYKGWAKGLKKAGYATNPEYAQRLIKIIEDYKLYELDQANNLPDLAAKEPVPVIVKEQKKIERKVFHQSNEVDPFGSRKRLTNNGVEYILARKGDTYKSLAKELELGYWQLPKYNEADDETPLHEGQIVYIKPKKSDATTAVYVVKNGDTVHSISQELGIKSKYIYKWNNLSPQQEVQSGQKIRLQKQKG